MQAHERQRIIKEREKIEKHSDTVDNIINNINNGSGKKL